MRIGNNYEDFSVTFSLSDVYDIENFVGREQELADMHRTLSRDGSRTTIVLHGLGGIGKTQLALAYAKKYKDNYSAIFWLDIKDENSLRQSFARISGQILRDHPAPTSLNSLDTMDLDKVIDAVKSWLSLPRNSRWLMVYDNYDTPRVSGSTDPTAIDIRKFLPESYQGSVIVTTRSAQVKIGNQIQITKLRNVSDSLEMLSSTSNRKGLADSRFITYQYV